MARTSHPEASGEPVEFVVEREVRFGDCDPAGIVFFPNYFRMLNCVVEDWWTAIGQPWRTMIGKRRLGTPTVRLDSEFVQPSFHGDVLRFHLTVEALGNASLRVRHVATCSDGTRLRAEQWLVCTSLKTHQSTPWPDDVRQAITRFMETT
ncbi:thioesterase family protein [Zoogloeaceae bacterium G21618-S1]|nr:thioesterase family protein [Zoogloeaceae bacterium G21618-S1]